MKQHEEKAAKEDGQQNEQQTIDTEIVEIARHPGSPVTITDLASLRDKGQEIIKYRVEILDSLRKASIKMTNPQDWLLFRADGDIVTGYLQDSGCARIMPLWGIDVKITSKGNEGVFEKTLDGDEFAYSVGGYGVCKVTQAISEEHTGIRYSYEDFCKDIAFKLKKAAYVKLAARANLDGHIVREIAGLERVPLEELIEAWKGTSKSAEKCAKGRGFGSRDTRMGQGDESTGTISPADIPVCTACQTKLVYRQKGNFWGCPNYQKHPNKKVIINHDSLLEEIAAKKASAGTADAGATQPNEATHPDALITERESDELFAWMSEDAKRKQICQKIMKDMGYNRRSEIKKKDLSSLYERTKAAEQP